MCLSHDGDLGLPDRDAKVKLPGRTASDVDPGPRQVSVFCLEVVMEMELKGQFGGGDSRLSHD